MKYLSAMAALAAVLAVSATGDTASTNETLSRAEALRLALERNPGIRAAGFAVQAADGRRRQAGVIPNPALSAEVEDFGGSGANRGFDGAQTTVGLEQTIELGGKLGLRKNAAALEMQLADQELAARRLDVINETTQRFIDVLAGQTELALRQAAWRTVEMTCLIVSNRVAAGKDSPGAGAMARTELALAKMQVERAASQLAVMRNALCAMWDDPAPAFAAVRGDLAEMAREMPDIAVLEAAMTRAPEWTRWANDLRAAELAVRAEYRNRIPDLKIGVGIRQTQADDSQSFVAAAGMDLPVFDRNTGRILAARAELERKRAEQTAAQSALRSAMLAAHARLRMSRNLADAIAREALPAAEQAFTAAQAAYAAGKIGHLEIQDAQRTLLETRRQQIEILAEYQHAVAQVERLAGMTLAEINRNQFTGSDAQ